MTPFNLFIFNNMAERVGFENIMIRQTKNLLRTDDELTQCEYMVIQGAGFSRFQAG